MNNLSVKKRKPIYKTRYHPWRWHPGPNVIAVIKVLPEQQGGCTSVNTWHRHIPDPDGRYIVNPNYDKKTEYLTCWDPGRWKKPGDLVEDW